MPKYHKPLKTQKHNIGMDENPKMDITGAYRDEKIVT